MMSEDELMKQALEDELEDSYQEYLTYALKGETQDLMQTSSEFRHNMEAMCREAENTEPKVVQVKPKKNKLAFRVKLISGLAAAAAVILLCVAGVSMLNRGLVYEDRSDSQNLIGQNGPEQNIREEFAAGTKAITADIASDVPEGDKKSGGEQPTNHISYPAVAAETRTESVNQAVGSMHYRTEFVALQKENEENNAVDGLPASEGSHLSLNPTRKADHGGGTFAFDGGQDPEEGLPVQIEVFLAADDGVVPSKILALYVEGTRVSFSETSRQEQVDGALVQLEYRAASDQETAPKEGRNIILIVLYGDSRKILLYRIV